MGFSRQEYWNGVPLPSPKCEQGILQFLEFQCSLCFPILLLPHNNNGLVFPFKSWYFKHSEKYKQEMNTCILVKQFYQIFTVSHVYSKILKENGEGNGSPLQSSCLENPIDRGAWWATVHGVTKSRTWLSTGWLTHSWDGGGDEKNCDAIRQRCLAFL